MPTSIQKKRERWEADFRKKNRPSPVDLNLEAHPTIWRFMQSDAPVRIVVGPLGSGKSTGVGCGEIMRRACEQEPSPKDNIRYFKALIVRNTMPELRKTTLKTWFSLYPENIGKFNHTSLTHTIKIKPTKDEPGLNLLVEFLGLDNPADAKKLLSWEGTIIWFNEAKEIEKSIVDMATGRVGRYPSEKQGGVFASWDGIIMDTNPYPTGHWLEEIERDLPLGWEVYRQPPAVLEMEKTSKGWISKEPNYPLSITDPDFIHKGGGCEWTVNPKAENLKYLKVNKQLDPTKNPFKRGGYYPRLLSGKDKAFITIYAQGKNGSLVSSSVVIPEFDPSTMVRRDTLYNPGLPLLCGLDFGAGTLYSAAVFGQLDPIHNSWKIIKEIAGIRMGLMEFADHFIYILNTFFGDKKIFRVWGDPAGYQHDGIFKRTYFDHLATKGIYALPAPSNDIDVRKECIKSPMLRSYKGLPSFSIAPECKILIEALCEKWHYPPLKSSIGLQYSDKPSKNHPYSDVADALGYLLSGGGEYDLIACRQIPENEKSYVMDTKWDPFEM